MQTALVIIVFALAVVYVGWKVFHSFSKKNEGCAKCDPASDISKFKKPVHGK